MRQRTDGKPKQGQPKEVLLRRRQTSCLVVVVVVGCTSKIGWYYRKFKSQNRPKGEGKERSVFPHETRTRMAVVRKGRTRLRCIEATMEKLRGLEFPSQTDMARTTELRNSSKWMQSSR